MTQEEIDSCDSWQGAIIVPESVSRNWTKAYIQSVERAVTPAALNFLGIKEPPAPVQAVALAKVGRRGGGSSPR